MVKIVIIEHEDLVRQGITFAVDWSSMDCMIVGEAKDGLEELHVVKEKYPF